MCDSWASWTLFEGLEALLDAAKLQSTAVLASDEERERKSMARTSTADQSRVTKRSLKPYFSSVTALADYCNAKSNKTNTGS